MHDEETIHVPCDGSVVRCAPNRQNTQVASAEHAFMCAPNPAIILGLCVSFAVHDPVLITAAQVVYKLRSQHSRALCTPVHANLTPVNSPEVLGRRNSHVPTSKPEWMCNGKAAPQSRGLPSAYGSLGTSSLMQDLSVGSADRSHPSAIGSNLADLLQSAGIASSCSSPHKVLSYMTFIA